MNKESIHKQLKRLNTEFKFRFPYFLKYQIFTKILLLTMILPIFTFIMNYIFRKAGVDIITNSQIINFSFSKAGLIFLLFLYITATLITLIEVGGLIIINNELLSKNSVGDYFSIIKFVIKRLPKFFGIGGILSVLCLFIFIGFTGTNLFQNLGILIKVPPFIKTYIDANTLYTVLYIIVIGLLLFFSTKWIFSLHFILLKNNTGLEALKSSTNLIKKNLRLFLSYLITGVIASIIMFLIISGIWFGLVYLIFLAINETSTIGRPIFALIMILTELLGLLLSSIIVPIIVYFVTDIFYTLSNTSPIILNLKTRSNINIIDKILRNKQNKFAISIGCIATLLSLTLASLIVLNDFQYNTTITAHKGNVTEAIENTIDALKVAISKDVEYVELDVQESKDGKLFLFHDTNFKRITGVNKNTNELNYSEIEALDIQSYNNNSLKGDKIPLLEDAIRVAKRNNQKLNIEVKVNTNVSSIATKLVDILQENNFVFDCVVTSLNYDVLQEIKLLNPFIKVGYHMYLVTGDVAKLNVDIISVEESVLTSKIIEDAHNSGKEVHVWTVNTQDAMNKFINLGVDNIITDDVDTLNNLLNELKSNRFNAKLSRTKLGI